MVKWPGETGGARKAIYHSYLVREPGLMLKLKGDPRASKYPGKPEYVYIQVPDDENEYALNIEPGTEDAFRDAPKNVWLRCHAKGSKDVPPSVHFADDAGPVFPGDRDMVEPSEAPPANEWPKDAKPTAPHSPAKADAATADAKMQSAWVDAVCLVRADFPEASADAAVEAASRMAISIFIQRSR